MKPFLTAAEGAAYVGSRDPNAFATEMARMAVPARMFLGRRLFRTKDIDAAFSKMWASNAAQANPSPPTPSQIRAARREAAEAIRKVRSME